LLILVLLVVVVIVAVLLLLLLLPILLVFLLIKYIKEYINDAVMKQGIITFNIRFLSLFCFQNLENMSKRLLSMMNHGDNKKCELR